MARIFLSYARDDVDSARQLADAIGRAGHEVWWDRHLHGGSRFTNEIDRALKDAEVVVVLWTDASVKSAWVQDEAAEGRDTERLVPVSLDGCRPPLGFRQFHTVDLAVDRKGEFGPLDELFAAIAKIAGEGSAAKASAAESDEEPQRQTSVCVLPFVNMSGDPEQEYFSDGITEDIITDLSKVSALMVIARNTAFTFKGKVMDVKEVAREAEVTHVMEGSVRKAGDRVRITAQLIDGATGGHVWADRYDRDLTDIFAIQDEISKAIVSALRVKLLPAEKKAIESRGTESVDAYNLYLMGRQQWISGNFGDPRRDEAIVRICQQATALDPEYAQAWALMALAQAELRFVHGRDENARPAAERALELNPSLPEAHCIKARYLEEEGRADEAEAQIRTALKLNPDSWEVNREAARMLFRHNHVIDAIPFFERAVALMDSDYHNALMLLTCYASLDNEPRIQDAAKITLERAERAVGKDPTNGQALAASAFALLIMGEDERAREWINRALLLDPDNLIMRYNLGCTLSRFGGSPEQAMDILAPFFERVNSTTFMRHIEVDPDLDPIREEPRFRTMLASAKQRLGTAA